MEVDRGLPRWRDRAWVARGTTADLQEAGLTHHAQDVLTVGHRFALAGRDHGPDLLRLAGPLWIVQNGCTIHQIILLQ